MDLYQEGAEILQTTQIEKILAEFGDVHLGGSYVYCTMVDRDLDFDVMLPSSVPLNIETRAHIGKRLLSLDRLRSLQMTDVYHFPEGSKHAIEGIWYGLTFISSSTKERWNVDIWFMAPGSKSEADPVLTEKLYNLSDDQRQTIINIKESALQAGTKEKGVTSTRVYEAVLLHGITTYEEFQNYIHRDS